MYGLGCELCATAVRVQTGREQMCVALLEAKTSQKDAEQNLKIKKKKNSKTIYPSYLRQQK